MGRPERPRRRHKPNSLYIHRPARASIRRRVREADETGHAWLTAWAVFLDLADLADDPEGTIRQSDRALAVELEVHRRTFRKATRLLERGGVLERIGRFVNDEEQEAGWQIVCFEELTGQVVGHAVGHAVGHSVTQHPGAEQADRSADLQDLQDKGRIKTVALAENAASATAIMQVFDEELRRGPRSLPAWTRSAEELAQEGFSPERVREAIRGLEEVGRPNTVSDLMRMLEYVDPVTRERMRTLTQGRDEEEVGRT